MSSSFWEWEAESAYAVSAAACGFSKWIFEALWTPKDFSHFANRLQLIFIAAKGCSKVFR